jgi:ribonuclease BN (tRNA processing enzyme)
MRRHYASTRGWNCRWLRGLVHYLLRLRFRLVKHTSLKRKRRVLKRLLNNEGTIVVKITLIPSATSTRGVGDYQYATSYLINETVAIDAGAIGFHQGPAEQAAIRHVFLSHSHFDHLASLPIFFENIADLAQTPVVLHASLAVQEALRLDIFNGRLWPNLLEMTHDNKPFVTINTITSGQTVDVDGLRITPIAVHHVVPTLGFLIEDAGAAVVISSDTGPTEEIWQRARQTPNLKAVFLEATFPDELAQLARVSQHLTAAGFVGEMRKLSMPARFLAVHLKAAHQDQVAKQLLAQGLANIEIAKCNVCYEF